MVKLFLYSFGYLNLWKEFESVACGYPDGYPLVSLTSLAPDPVKPALV